MKTFQEKSKPRQFFESTPVLILLSVILILFVFGIVNFAKKAIEASRKRELAEERINELEGRKVNLENDIENLETDFGKERVFRENFGMGRPGEGVVVVVEPKDGLGSEGQKKGFWYFVRGWFTDD